MEETGFIQKQNYRRVIVLKGSSNVWSKCADANFHTTFVVCVSDAKSIATPLLIPTVNMLNMDVIKGCDTGGARVTKSPKDE